MGLTRTTAPALEPVSTVEVKEFLRIDPADDSQDIVIGILIKSARETVEEYIRRSLITQTWTWTVGAREMINPIYLPRVPIISITSFTVYDENAAGAETSSVVDTANYQLVEGQFLVERNSGWTWNRRDRAATIVYTAGYGSSASDVPAPIRTAILRLVGNEYEYREKAGELQGLGNNVLTSKHHILTDIDDYRYGGL